MRLWLLETYQFIRHLLQSKEIMDLSTLHDNKHLRNAVETFSVIFPVAALTSILTYVRMRNFTKNFKMFFIEFFVLVVPILFYLTVFVGTIYKALMLSATIIVGIVISLFWAHLSKRPKLKFTTISTSQHSLHCTFITNTRAAINLLTVISILAVDFKIFPTHYQKTRTYGFSLMDFGVGLFIYSSAIVAPKREESFTKIIRGSAILFVLGIGRYLVTTKINYHVSAWEYGLHWNFCITLAVTRVFSSLLIKLTGQRFLFIIGPLLLALHETLLQNGLADFVFSNRDRKESFIVANREGIVSSLGCIALYLISVSIGNVLKDNIDLTVMMMAKTTSLSLITLLGIIVLNNLFQTSRTLANSAYCCWTLFIGVFMTELNYCCETVQRICTGCKYIPPSLLSEAINYNGLVYFLICNLLTGLVNLIFETRTVETVDTLLILAVYMFVSCAFVVVLFLKKIKLKL